MYTRYRRALARAHGQNVDGALQTRLGEMLPPKRTLSSILAAAYELEVSGVVEPDGDFHRGWGTSTTAAKDTIPNRARA